MTGGSTLTDTRGLHDLVFWKSTLAIHSDGSTVLRMWCKSLTLNQTQAFTCTSCGARYWD